MDGGVPTQPCLPNVKHHLTANVKFGIWNKLMIPTTMRYVTYGEGGGPEVLRIVEGQIPEIGPREVLIRDPFCRGQSSGHSATFRDVSSTPGGIADSWFRSSGASSCYWCRCDYLESRGSGLRLDTWRRLRRILPGRRESLPGLAQRIRSRNQCSHSRKFLYRLD